MRTLWRVAMTTACGAMAAGNFLRLEDEGDVARKIAAVSLGAAWVVLGAWVFFGSEE